MKRAELLKLSEEGLKLLKRPFQLRKEKKSLEGWVIDCEEQVAVLESEINDLKAEENLDVDKILNKEDDLALAKRRLTQGEALMKELFG